MSHTPLQQGCRDGHLPLLQADHLQAICQVQLVSRLEQSHHTRDLQLALLSDQVTTLSQRQQLSSESNATDGRL